MSKDISLILSGWDYNPSEVTVRKITGQDGRARIQMRLDLGVLQMEAEGRPDGRQPHGWPTSLDYYQHRLERYQQRFGDNEGFELTGDECAELRQESMQFYYRYLSLFHLGDYLEVLRDTEHNLRLFDMIRDYGEDESERNSMEQFRPYVMMMNTRARACISLEEKDFDRALGQIEYGIERIEDFLHGLERDEMMDTCREVAFLQEWSERIRSNRPISREEKLRRELQMAVEQEDYERAARLRDQIKEMVH